MAEYIKLVQGDTGPQIKVTLTDETTGAAISLVGAQVVMHFREVGTVTVLDSLVGFVLDGPAGIAVFEWGLTTLDVPEGTYEGEIEVTFVDGMRQSVFAVLIFSLREEFA